MFRKVRDVTCWKYDDSQSFFGTKLYCSTEKTPDKYIPCFCTTKGNQRCLSL
jgi:hypothetical protein